MIAPALVSAAGGAANLTDGQRAAIAGISTLLGGVTAGLAGQNAQAGATAAENEVLNNTLGEHRTEAQKDQDEIKEELSQERAKLSGGEEIIGYDAQGNPVTAYKPPPSMFGPGGAVSSPSNMGDILLPNGQPVGYVNTGAGPGIRTVTPDQFGQLQSQLLNGAQPTTTPSGYSGTWYQRSDGTVFGIRESSGSGTTIDVIRSNNPGLPPGFKVHQK